MRPVFLTIIASSSAFVVTPALHRQHSTQVRAAPHVSEKLFLRTVSGPFMGLTISPYDKLLNEAAPIVVPFLVSIAPLLKPLYKLLDAIFGKMNPSAERATKTNAYKPVVVFTSRTVKDVTYYKAAWAKYAQEAQSTTAGVRACFSFMDREKKNTALQFTWYDSAADIVSEPPSLVDCYVGTPETDYCQIWGGWDDEFKAKLTAVGGAEYGFVKEMRGFLKEPNAANAKGFDTGEMPMIWISRRQCLKGRGEIAGKNFQVGTDQMYDAAPAALGIIEYTTDEDPDANWSLRVFNDYDAGFKAHFPVPSFILFRMVFNVIPEWIPGPFPLGFSFSSKEYIENAVASNGGNKAYKPYYFESEDLIGPKPAFGKGF